MHISVILPAYNAAPHLNHTLQSLRAQTLADWEALCVDDGSKDNSAQILTDTLRCDPRLKLIHQPNRGVSTARNRALDRIRGDYYTFIDADDTIDPDHLEHLYTLTTTNHATIGVVNALSEGIHYGAPYAGVLPPTPARLLCGPLWNKLYHRATLGHHRFKTHLTFGEDCVYLLILQPDVRRMAFDLSYIGYHYQVRPHSLSHGHNYTFNITRHWDDILVLDTLPDKDALIYFLRSADYVFLKNHTLRDAFAIANYTDARRELFAYARRPLTIEEGHPLNPHFKHVTLILGSPLPRPLRALLHWTYTKLLVTCHHLKKALTTRRG